ncbi:type III pantothenate kinase [Alteromonas sp. ASW11-36]|uniref:Type III pantothenate kinase n=1 Tax=Alteromonas arenosi TaxID=3055817 RepID=A0ABT7SYZ7_9ALTE|nr:type III pantothenate kinase [Alteromonas sp. ASW11-36]MDM7861418.1 type III pantothenate kinase [Alteromonas sp. ASW11-36]
MAHRCSLIDVGNSTLKAVTLEVTAIEEAVAVISPIRAYEDIEQWLGAQNNDGHHHKVWFASVRDDPENQRIHDFLHQHGMLCEQVNTSEEAFGIKNSYAQVSKMGVDRWLALLGAELLSDGDCLVADAGTALTVDALIDKQHVGGWISPGLQLAKDAVTGNTRRVFQDPQAYQQLAFGNDTEQCLALGCMAQLYGTLMVATQVMQQQQTDFTLIISGGDAPLIKSISNKLPLPQSFIYTPNIVILGLLRFALADHPLKSVQKTAQSLVI